MIKVEELMVHPPAMAEMAGAVVDFETHLDEPGHMWHPDEVPLSLAKLEAETED